MSLAGQRVDADRLFFEIERMVHERLDAQFVDAAWEGFLRGLALNALDEAWFSHLEDMDELRRGIGLVAIGEQDPQLVYAKRAYELWQQARVGFENRVVQVALGATPVAAGAAAAPASPAAVQKRKF